MRNLIFISFLLLCLCANSWGACVSADRWSTMANNSAQNCFQYTMSQPLPSCGWQNDGVCFTGSQSNLCACTEYPVTSVCLPSIRNPSYPYNGYYTAPDQVGANDSRCNPGGGGARCHYSIFCDTQAEADSVANSLSCDSTTWTCETSNEVSQVTYASQDITCFDGECYGGVWCEYKTTTITECRNSCGQIETQIAEFPMRYEGRCNDETNPDEEMCSKQMCMSQNDNYYLLYKMCKNRNQVNGESQVIPVFTGSGRGTCKNAGYEESNPNFNPDSLLNSSDSTTIPKECLTMGINCPLPDSVDYSEQANRNSENGCICKKYDGLSHISQIVCPDGSVSVFFGSCNDWNTPPVSSSSVSPESSGGGSAASSGDSGEMPTDWVKYSQGEDIKSLLGIIAVNTGKEQQFTQNVNNAISVNLDDYASTISGGDSALVIPDSMLVVSPDTSGFNPLRDSLLKALFSRIDSNNSIIDTLSFGYSGCPSCDFFGGSNSTPSTSSGLALKGFTINFCNIFGFNFIRVASAVVVAIASIIGAFIGFSIFKNVSP